ncbi:MAG: hypothetical protein AB1345_03335 [Chloroflexota bacterium]
MSIKDDTLDRLFTAVAKSLHGEPPFFIWPAPYSTPAECEFYLADEFLQSFYNDIAQLNQQGYSLENIARKFKFPSRIAQTLWPFGHTVDVNEEFKQKLIELSYTIIKLLSYYREDPYNSDGKNIIWSSNQIKSFYSNNIMHEKGSDFFDKSKLLISRVEGTLWMYSELLYFSIHEICKEFHGPYQMSDGRIVLVREYYDLKPGFWEFTKDFPCESVRVFEIYQKGTDISLDFFGRLTSTQSTIHNLEGFSLSIDQEPIIDYSEIKKILNDIVQISSLGSEQLQRLSRLEIMNKFIQSYYYLLKPLKDELGKSWEPPESIMKDVENDRKKEFIEQTYEKFREISQLHPNETIKIVSAIFDPRKR